MTAVTTTARPHLLSRRAALGLDDHATPQLAEAARVWRSGFVDLDAAVAHLVLGARATTGSAASTYVRDRVHQYVDALDDDKLDDLADALVDDARSVEACRLHRETT